MTNQLLNIIKEHGDWMELQKRKFSINGEFFSIRVNAIAGEDIAHHAYVRLAIENDMIVAYQDRLHNGEIECVASEQPRFDERNIAVKYKGEHVVVFIHLHVDTFIRNIAKYREVDDD